MMVKCTLETGCQEGGQCETFDECYWKESETAKIHIKKPSQEKPLTADELMIFDIIRP